VTDAFTWARLRRLADPYAAIRPLSVPADPYATAPLRMPWQADVFAPIDHAIAAAEHASPAVADTAFRRPTPDVFGAIDFARLARYQTPVFDTNWQRSTPFAFEPLDPATMARLQQYRGRRHGQSPNEEAAQSATLKPDVLSRLQRYRRAPEQGRPPLAGNQPLSAATRAKIADVEAFNPPKSEWQAWAEQLLEAQSISPGSWSLAELVDPYWRDEFREAPEAVFGALGALFFVGPDGQIYSREEPALEDGFTSVKKQYQDIQHHADVADWLDDGAPVDRIPPEVLTEILVAMAGGGVRPGRYGSKITAKELKEMQDKYEHPDYEYIAGGFHPNGKRRKERAIPGPGVAFSKPGKTRGDGRRFSVFFDLLQRRRDNHEKLRGINHVDVDADGKPTERELDAAERARRAVEFIDIILEPKQHQLNALRRRKRHPLDED
jgi:hypothetical protein